MMEMDGHLVNAIYVLTPKEIMLQKIKTPYNSTYQKGGVSCSKDSFVVIQTLVFQIKFCGKSPTLRVAAKRDGQP